MRPEDIIDDFFKRLFHRQWSVDTVGRELLDELERHQMTVRDDWDDDWDDDGDYE